MESSPPKLLKVGPADDRALGNQGLEDFFSVLNNQQIPFYHLSDLKEMRPDLHQSLKAIEKVIY